jgi:hypothetical protein
LVLINAANLSYSLQIFIVAPPPGNLGSGIDRLALLVYFTHQSRPIYRKDQHAVIKVTKKPVAVMQFYITIRANKSNHRTVLKQAQDDEDNA